MKPTLSRIVHYVLPHPSFKGGEGARPHRTAIITDEKDETPALTVFLVRGDVTRIPGAAIREGETAQIPAGIAKHDEVTKAPGTWHWPESEAVSDDELVAQRELEKQKLRGMLEEIREEDVAAAAAAETEAARAPATVSEPELVDSREAVEELGDDHDEKEAA